MLFQLSNMFRNQMGDIQKQQHWERKVTTTKRRVFPLRNASHFHNEKELSLLDKSGTKACIGRSGASGDEPESADNWTDVSVHHMHSEPDQRAAWQMQLGILVLAEASSCQMWAFMGRGQEWPHAQQHMEGWLEVLVQLDSTTNHHKVSGPMREGLFRTGLR